jgi:hypothetical protein
VTALLTCIISVNFWRDEIAPSLRLKVDKAMANISFIIFTVMAVISVRDWWVLIVGWPCWAGVVGFFTWSKKWSTAVDAGKRDDRGWVFPHAMFHVCVSIGQAIVIIGIARS